MTKINSSLYEALKTFNLPGELGFGRTMVPAMFRADYIDNEWQESQLLPYQALSLDPASKVLHYGQCIFEGMKAYKVKNKEPLLFRPLDNWRRMNQSAARLCMPEIPQEIFMDGISYVSAFSVEFIPNKTGQSLYLRPFMICASPDLSLSHSNHYSFMVIASPSAAYHAGAMSVFIQRDQCRSAIGGTGAVKAGGNYASALQAAKHAEAKNFHQSLWLDPEHREYVEELSGMNIFALINGVLHTPALTDSMLAGITRDSVIQLARAIHLDTIERNLSINELLNDIHSGACTEIFSCGTAAIITSISMLGDKDGNNYELPAHYPIADKLRAMLLDIQEGTTEDKFAWTHHIPTTYYPDSQLNMTL